MAKDSPSSPPLISNSVFPEPGSSRDKEYLSLCTRLQRASWEPGTATLALQTTPAIGDQAWTGHIVFLNFGNGPRSTAMHLPRISTPPLRTGTVLPFAQVSFSLTS